MLQNKHPTVKCSFIKNINWNKTQPSNCALNNTVDIWRVKISSNLSLLPVCVLLLSPDEILRTFQFQQKNIRQKFIISRGILKIILAKYLFQNSEKISFAKNENGKPFLKAIHNSLIQFNTSHAGDWLLIAIADSDVGIDVEKVEDDFMYDDVATRCFSIEEQEYLSRSLYPEKKFYQLWTRKEAIVKAASVGIVDNLSSVSGLTGYNTLDTGMNLSSQSLAVDTFNFEDYTASVAYNSGHNIQFYNYNNL